MSDDQIYADGWVELSSPHIVRAYWLDGFPIIADEETREWKGYGPDGRTSPILTYDDGGIGKVEWVNVTHDKAAILCADGGWKTGGKFHLWVSPGAGTLAHEVHGFKAPQIVAGDPSGWYEAKEGATAAARSYLGLRPIK